MALDFPNPPLTNGQIFAAPNGVSYTWDAVPGRWNDVSPGLPSYYGPNAVVFDFRNAQYTWAGALVSLDLALRCERPDTVPALAYNHDGTWTSFAADEIRIAEGEGLLIEPATTNRMLWPRDFSNAVWDKSNLALTDPGVSPIRGESTGATRITATAAGAYLAQDYTPSVLTSAVWTGSISGTTMTVTAVTSGRVVALQIVLGTGVTAHTTIVAQLTGPFAGPGTYSVNIAQTVPAGTTLKATYDRVPSAVLRPVTVTGPIYLSQDGGLTQTDIRPQLQAGRWPQVYTPYDAVELPQWRLTFANSGDSIDIDLAQLEDRSFPTSPVPSLGTQATRQDDVVTLNLDAFPPWVNADALTILQAIKPGGQNVRVVDGFAEQSAFTWVDIRGFDTAAPMGTATGSVALIPIFNVTAATVPLALKQGLVGGGLPAGSEIFRQFSGPAGGLGEYVILPQQTFASTTTNVVAQQAYTCNAAYKPEEEMSRVGCTVVNSRAVDPAFGFDPQIEFVSYNQWQRVGFSTTASLAQGITALRGDVEHSPSPALPGTAWADPSKFTTVTLGNQPPGANNLAGLIGIIVFIPFEQWTGEQLAAWTVASYGVS